MAITNFYQRLLELPNLEITGVSTSSSKITLEGKLNTPTCNCPHCGEASSIINQRDSRQIRDLNISGKEVWLDIEIRQFVCYVCNRYFKECPSWAFARKTYTKRQAKWVFTLCAKQPFKEVAAQVNMSQKTVERLYYAQAITKIDIAKRYKQVRKIGIDELSHRKGKKDFVCVLTDLERGIQLEHFTRP